MRKGFLSSFKISYLGIIKLENNFKVVKTTRSRWHFSNSQKESIRDPVTCIKCHRPSSFQGSCNFTSTCVIHFHETGIVVRDIRSTWIAASRPALGKIEIINRVGQLKSVANI